MTLRTAILSGPTATGKTSLALQFAQAHGQIEIINADSLLIYRGFDIGTAKPSQAELTQAPHHLIDIKEPNEEFTAGDFVRLVNHTLDEIHGKGKRAMIVGGSGFYLKALLYGLWQAPPTDPKVRSRLQEKSNDELYTLLFQQDERSALRIGKNDRYRMIRALELIELGGKTPSELRDAEPKSPDPKFELWVVDRTPEELYSRIKKRTDAMIQANFIEEVQTLRQKFASQSPIRPLSAVGYREVCNFLDGIQPAGRKIPPGIQGLKSEINLATRQLVKSQRTWFRGQKSAHWFELDRDLALLKSAFSDLYEAGF